MKQKISVDEAMAILSGLKACGRTEVIPAAQARGRVLAEDIRASVAVPQFDRSPYDGYAIRGEDTADASRENPAVLRITEEIPAGKAPEYEVTAGMAAKILTGAPVPKGANAVIKYEITEFTDEYVKVFKPVKPDTDIVYAGEDVQAGQLLAEKGSVITPALSGVLAAQGIAQVKVFARPRAFLLCTGTELLEPGQPLENGKIYNSNSSTIGGYLEQLGLECVDGGCVPDDEESIARSIDSALDSSDIIVTTGGASVGDYDFALRSAQRIGAEILFWEVNMKPGGSVVAAEKGGKLILNLSGNPGAAVITLLRVASPYIKKLCGRKDTELEAVTLVMRQAYNKKSPRRRMVRGRLVIEDGVAYFQTGEGQGNGVVSSLVGCDMLAEIPAGTPAVEAGALVKAYRV